MANIEKEVFSNLNSSFVLALDSSCSSFDKEDGNYLSYEDLLSSCNLISEQYFKLKQKFEAFLF